MRSPSARIGALLYVLWGVLHINAAIKTYQLGSSMPAGLERGRVLQDSWNLGWIAVLAIVVAAWLNWKNNRTGYWINLVVLGLTDVGFVVTVLLPGYLPLFPEGITGPVVWLLAVVFSTRGYPHGREA